MDYLKIGKATELSGKDRKIYRLFEILPGFLSWGTLLGLLTLSYFKPLGVSLFIIVFDVYWLLLVLYLGIHLFVAYKRLKKNKKVDWKQRCLDLEAGREKAEAQDSLSNQGWSWRDITHLIILPTYNESLDVIRPTFQALAKENYPLEKMVVVLAIEGRGGEEVRNRAEIIKKEFGHKFGHFLITVHPDGIPGEIKGKGANQAWAAQEVKERIIDPQGFDYDRIVVSVFDIDTMVEPGYFFCLTHRFLTVSSPHRASYQPVPVYHNNIWEAPFFARVAASSNTFWQMMQQIRQEKLATYSSHSMSFRTLLDIGLWSTNMVSEDSRIFWHSFLFYKGDYRVEPLYFPVSMDVTMDESFFQTARNLYKQQRRWGWGVENVPYLMFNFLKKRHELPKKKVFNKIFVQIYGFHAWATNALIIAVIGWMPILIGGEQFSTTVMSGNLPAVTRGLMTLAMIGLVFSAIVSTLLLPPRPKKYRFHKSVVMVVQWVFLPISIILFGAFPALESQTRLMLGKYLGFWVTPKSRK